MKTKIKKELLKALRDPKTKQTTHALQRSDGSMCCLGVLCDIVVDDHWVLAGEVYYLGDRSAFPSPGQLALAGLRNGEASHLASMNDEGKTFLEIADWIEENL